MPRTAPALNMRLRKSGPLASLASARLARREKIRQMAEDCDAYRDLSNEPDLTDVPPEAWQFFGVGFDTGVEETAAVANEIPETCAEVDDANTTTMIDSTRKLTGGRTVLTMREITISAVVYEELPQT